MNDLITEDQFRQLLRNRVRDLGGAKVVARQWRIQQEFLEAVLNGQEYPGTSPTCCKQMGYRAEVMFKKVQP